MLTSSEQTLLRETQFFSPNTLPRSTTIPSFPPRINQCTFFTFEYLYYFVQHVSKFSQYFFSKIVSKQCLNLISTPFQVQSMLLLMILIKWYCFYTFYQFWYFHNILKIRDKNIRRRKKLWLVREMISRSNKWQYNLSVSRE